MSAQLIQATVKPAVFPAHIAVTPHAEGVSSVLRPAQLKDAEQITAMINHYAALGEMLPRKEESVRQHIHQFVVAEANHKVIACGALHHWDSQSAEIRSLAVAEEYAGQGLGTRIVKVLDAMGAQLGYEYAFALTLKVRFFEKLGYGVVSKSVLPQKIWGDCIICPFLYNCRETAVLKQYRV